MAALPFLDMPDDPRERGLIHGREMADAIRANLRTYLDRFAAGGAAASDVMAESERWETFIGTESPEYAEEMRAVARGAGLSGTELAMLNARYEITYSVFGAEARKGNAGPEQEGCTSFGLMPEATQSGRTILAQNWDWIAGVRGRCLVQRVTRASAPGDGKPGFVGFTEAGIVGCKMGVNSAGIGLCVNGLVTARDGANGMRKPFHVRCREILDAWTFDKALAPVVATDRTCSTNFLIGHADGEIIDIEATPDFCAFLYPTDGMVVHANHLVKETRVASEFERIAPHSLYRAARCERLLRRHKGRIGMREMHAAMTDHFSAPNAICRHPDTSLPEPKRVITVAAIVVDLSARVLYATDGQPCQDQFQAFALHAEAVSTAA